MKGIFLLCFLSIFAKGFVQMPLELKSRHGLAVLALIITATPGTIWVEFDRARSILLVHILDLVD